MDARVQIAECVITGVNPLSVLSNFIVSSRLRD